ncbi:hypothetical protein M427DRAFT_33751 [Gonapodya prolifera JEL478]|uniref:Uncharacterized protein n=1 Tax=Gonapodya prolifera (strain JEL478) TaxID=1344416 RepID=A0A139AAG0_GONPJ|nr:hypothetical protein M427DRAFT_33751 [Gonapodya prolifera JEL478]|eukprot:KXS13791.1 hypothetical protein M427DRAFT_33751 [Gonapodya prolifera JEL478]
MSRWYATEQKDKPADLERLKQLEQNAERLCKEFEAETERMRVVVEDERKERDKLTARIAELERINETKHRALAATETRMRALELDFLNLSRTNEALERERKDVEESVAMVYMHPSGARCPPEASDPQSNIYSWSVDILYNKNLSSNSPTSLHISTLDLRPNSPRFHSPAPAPATCYLPPAPARDRGSNRLLQARISSLTSTSTSRDVHVREGPDEESEMRLDELERESVRLKRRVGVLAKKNGILAETVLEFKKNEVRVGVLEVWSAEHGPRSDEAKGSEDSEA